MQVYLFQSLREPDVFGFTGDATGTNLPDWVGPWTPSGKCGAIETGLNAGMGASGPLLTAFEQTGFYVARSETLSRNTGIPWIK